MTIKTILPEKIGTIVDALLRERGYLVQCKELGVVRAWASLVGPRLSEITECTRAEQGILFVRVSSAAWRQEISFMKDLLLTKIRMETGCTTIKDIVFY
jgi:predicted nucleic acid-binding Zn ribbon protein